MLGLRQSIRGLKWLECSMKPNQQFWRFVSKHLLVSRSLPQMTFRYPEKGQCRDQKTRLRAPWTRNARLSR